MRIASTRYGASADEGCLSAQVNCGVSLPVHKDNNHGEIWLIGLGIIEVEGCGSRAL